jgi:hypothetical protein
LELQYLPIEGLAAFNKATAELLLGADNQAIKQQRVCSGFRRYNCFEGCNIYWLSDHRNKQERNQYFSFYFLPRLPLSKVFPELVLCD